MSEAQNNRRSHPLVGVLVWVLVCLIAMAGLLSLGPLNLGKSSGPPYSHEQLRIGIFLTSLLVLPIALCTLAMRLKALGEWMHRPILENSPGDDAIATVPARQLQLSLRRLLLWIVPLVAICTGVISCRLDDPLGHSQTQSSAVTVGKSILVGLIVVVWAILVWEDRKALKSRATAND